MGASSNKAISILLALLMFWAPVAFGIAEHSICLEMTSANGMDSDCHGSGCQDECPGLVCAVSNYSSTVFMNFKPTLKIESVSEAIAAGYPPEYSSIISDLFIRPPIA